jgi:hypothetical protein
MTELFILEITIRLSFLFIYGFRSDCVHYYAVLFNLA